MTDAAGNTKDKKPRRAFICEQGKEEAVESCSQNL
jgi:hypothetical protein